MAISLYDAVVAGFIQSLSGVSNFLEKGRAHCEATGVDANDLVDYRLTTDMLPFSFQISSVAHHSIGAITGVKAGLFTPGAPVPEPGYAGLQKLIAEAQVALAALTPDEVNGLEGKDMVFKIGEMQMPFTAEGFLLSFSLPNLHFHATTAYDILRLKGAPLGKRDFLGQPRMKR
ncbi:MAG: hypothetical protein CGW95_10485 [Phenylobacterium zucineum]|nr:MAG: hypothetical protein CGW95_10485 [Phenylobacterium zucineum]